MDAATTVARFEALERSMRALEQTLEAHRLELVGQNERHSKLIADLQSTFEEQRIEILRVSGEVRDVVAEVTERLLRERGAVAPPHVREVQ